MNDLGFVILIIFAILYYNGNLEKYFPNSDKDKIIKEDNKKRMEMLFSNSGLELNENMTIKIKEIK